MERNIVKVLNLYSGCGGNRKFWKNVEVVAVEFNQAIADIYSHYYPEDTVIVGDAHQYLLENHDSFDFIWSSPPCPTHSKIRLCGAKRKLYPAVYPDIKLWEEVTFLKHHAGMKCKWVVENVQPYYEPIVQPTFTLDRHCFWSNFYVQKAVFSKRETAHIDINSGNRCIFGFDISDSPGLTSKEKGKVLRNMVNPEVGRHIFETGMQTRGDRPEWKQGNLFCQA